ncbi:hypothetical protein [Chromohalobacter canadensis]|nr:hypothetical protein [Chromohalobacter canadensis]
MKTGRVSKLLMMLYALRRIIILIAVTAVSVYVLSQVQLFETLGAPS